MSPLRARLMDIMGFVDGDYQPEKLKIALRSSDWVSDSELMKKITDEPLYDSATSKALGAIFRGIERALSGAGAMRFEIGKQNGGYSVEHIYPQKNLQWLKDIENWGHPIETYESRKHTIGNLTVVTHEHNSVVGNKPFADKQLHPTVAGAAAPLSINKDWLNPSIAEWTPAYIDQRSGKLLAAALEYWREI